MDIITLLLIILAIVAAVFLWRISRRKQQLPERSDQAKALDIRNVEVGGVVSLSGVGDELENFDVVVEGRHVYNEDGFEWSELEGTNGTEKVYLEIEDDDELEVSLTLQRLKLSDVGASPEKLQQITAADSGALMYNGVHFQFEEVGEAKFYRNGDRNSGECFRYWDFESDDGTRLLSVELWGEKHYEVFLSEPLSPSQVRVFVNKG